MSKPTITFRYLGADKREDGLIDRYNLEVTNTCDGKVEQISLKPSQLASPLSMKRYLLGRCMFYSATRKEHNQMLSELFDPQSESNLSSALRTAIAAKRLSSPRDESPI